MNAIDLTGRVAIVTGGASGLGRATAERFARSGATVCVWDAQATLLNEVRTGSGPGLIDTDTVDVTSCDAVERATAAVTRRYGRLDILFNCAGTDQRPTPLAELSLAEWDRVLRVNLNGVFHCCRAAVPAMKAGQYGRIVNVSSIAGKEGNANMAAYSASKAGVIALTKSLAKELARDSIVVNCMAPSIFDTPMHRRTRDADPALMAAIVERVPMARIGRADEFAGMAAWLASAECSFTTGYVFDLSGGRATY